MFVICPESDHSETFAQCVDIMSCTHDPVTVQSVEVVGLWMVIRIAFELS